VLYDAAETEPAISSGLRGLRVRTPSRFERAGMRTRLRQDQAGLRDELVEMQFDDVDFDSKIVTVRAKTDKGHRSREIPLDDGLLQTIAVLKEEAKHRQPVPGNSPKQTRQQLANFSRSHVFVSKANTPLKNNLLRRFYRICDKAGISGAEPGGSVDIHSLRVSFTTISLEHGAKPKAIQAILGHATLDLTMGIYARANDNAKRDAIGSLPYSRVGTGKNPNPS